MSKYMRSWYLSHCKETKGSDKPVHPGNIVKVIADHINHQQNLSVEKDPYYFN